MRVGDRGVGDSGAGDNLAGTMVYRPTRRPGSKSGPTMVAYVSKKWRNTDRSIDRPIRTSRDSRGSLNNSSYDQKFLSVVVL